MRDAVFKFEANDAQRFNVAARFDNLEQELLRLKAEVAFKLDVNFEPKAGNPALRLKDALK